MKELAVSLSKGRLSINADAYVLMDLKKMIDQVLSHGANGEEDAQAHMKVQGKSQYVDVSMYLVR